MGPPGTTMTGDLRGMVNLIGAKNEATHLPQEVRTQPLTTAMASRVFAMLHQEVSPGDRCR
jgi:hypothetical protein